MISDMQRSGFMETAQDRDLSMSDSALTTTIVETFTTPVVIERLIASLTPETRARLETAAFAHLSPSDLAGIDQEAALKRFVSNNLEVSHSGRSYVIRVKFTAKDPVLSADIANAATAAYLLHRADVKQGAFARMLAEIEDDLDGLGAQLQGAEQTAQVMREQVEIVRRRSESLMGAQQDTAIEEAAALFSNQRAAERRADVIAAVYEQLLFNRQNIEARLSAPDLSVQPFSPADVPANPVGLDVKLLIVPMALAAGFFLSLTLSIWHFRARRKPLAKRM